MENLLFFPFEKKQQQLTKPKKELSLDEDKEKGWMIMVRLEEKIKNKISDQWCNVKLLSIVCLKILKIKFFFFKIHIKRI